jgi:hypothetical protein
MPPKHRAGGDRRRRVSPQPGSHAFGRLRQFHVRDARPQETAARAAPGTLPISGEAAPDAGAPGRPRSID